MCKTWKLKVMWDYAVGVEVDANSGAFRIDRMEVKNVGDGDFPAGGQFIVKANHLNVDGTPMAAFKLYDTGNLPAIPAKQKNAINPGTVPIPRDMRLSQDRWQIAVFCRHIDESTQDYREDELYRSPAFTMELMDSLNDADQLEKEALESPIGEHVELAKSALSKLQEAGEIWTQLVENNSGDENAKKRLERNAKYQSVIKWTIPALQDSDSEEQIKLWKDVFDRWDELRKEEPDNTVIYRNQQTAKKKLQPLLTEAIDKYTDTAKNTDMKEMVEELIDFSEKTLQMLRDIDADRMSIITGSAKLKSAKDYFDLMWSERTESSPTPEDAFQRLIYLSPSETTDFSVAISAAKTVQSAGETRATSWKQAAGRPRSINPDIPSAEDIMNRNVRQKKENTAESTGSPGLNFHEDVDPIVFNFVAQQPCYITLLNFTTDREIVVLIPDKNERTRYISAEGTHHLPEQIGDWIVVGPKGRSMIKMIASEDPIPPFDGWTKWSDDEDYGVFRAIAERDLYEFADFLETKLHGFDTQKIAWAEATCEFQVV